MYFLVSKPYNFLIGWSAKAGCSTLKRWYLGAHQVNWEASRKPVYKIIGYGNTKYSRVNWSRAGKYSNFGKYAFVRNPYSRLVSGFVNKYVDGDKVPNYGWESFNEFIAVLSSDEHYRKVDRHHFTPQFSEDYDDFLKAGFSFDRVFKMEELGAGLDEIAELHGIAQAPVLAANKTVYNGTLQAAGDLSIESLRTDGVPPFEYFYDNDTLRTVEKIYAADFSAMKELGLSYERPECL